MRARKPNQFLFKDDGVIPNHPHWPAILYRGVVKFSEEFDPAAVLEVLFETHGWGNSWRNGVYPYTHYHSRIHEVLGVARGTAKLRIGGKRGRTISLKAGDVIVLPAGTGHQCLAATKDFLAVGAYPTHGKYDECTSLEDRPRSLKAIRKTGRPRSDPVFGSKGPLREIWTERKGSKRGA